MEVHVTTPPPCPECGGKVGTHEKGCKSAIDWSDLDKPRICTTCGTEYVGHEHKLGPCIEALKSARLRDYNEAFRAGLMEAAGIVAGKKRYYGSSIDAKTAFDMITAAINAKLME